MLLVSSVHEAIRPCMLHVDARKYALREVEPHAVAKMNSDCHIVVSGSVSTRQEEKKRRSAGGVPFGYTKAEAHRAGRRT